MSYFTLDSLQIASPCDALWDDMQGTPTVRACAQCEKNVYDISLLTRAEATALIQEKEGKLCVRLYRREDGTILTSDCPKGLKRVRHEFIKARAKTYAYGAAFLSMIGLSAIGSQGTRANSYIHDSLNSTIELDTPKQPLQSLQGETSVRPTPKVDSTRLFMGDTIFVDDTTKQTK
jgi:hypothetical protein